MKRKKILFLSTMLLACCILVTSCEKKNESDGENSGTTSNSVKSSMSDADKNQLIDDCINASKDVKSVTSSTIMNMKLGELKMSVKTNDISFVEPFKIKSSGTMDLSITKQAYDSYSVIKNNQVYTYMKQTTSDTWTVSTTDVPQGSSLTGSAIQIEPYLTDRDTVAVISQDKINGLNTTHLSAAVPLDKLLSAFNRNTIDSMLSGLDLDAATALATNSNVDIWIYNDSKNVAKIAIDLSTLIQNLLQTSSGSSLNGITVSDTSVEITYGAHNQAKNFRVPSIKNATPLK